MGQVIGYARVSSASQSLEVQLEKLRGAGCTKIFCEKRSGSDLEPRVELKAALEYVREGDTLCVTKLDRMARSVVDLARISETLKRKRVAFRALDQAIDTGTSEGRLMFNMLGAFAQFENELKRERQLDGITKARQNGVRFGRREALSPEQRARIRSLRLQEAFSIAQLSERFGVGRSTVYRALAES